MYIQIKQCTQSVLGVNSLPPLWHSDGQLGGESDISLMCSSSRFKPFILFQSSWCGRRSPLIYMYIDSFKFELSLNTKEKYETMCEFIQRGSKGTLFWTALGVFSHHLGFLVLVKTLLWNQLFFSLTVSTLMFIIIISSLFMGAVNLYLGAVHPNSGHWIIGQVSIRPLTGHKNWFGSESSGNIN